MKGVKAGFFKVGERYLREDAIDAVVFEVGAYATAKTTVHLRGGGELTFNEDEEIKLLRDFATKNRARGTKPFMGPAAD